MRRNPIAASAALILLGLACHIGLSQTQSRRPYSGRWPSGSQGWGRAPSYRTAAWPRDTKDPFKNQANWEAFDAGDIGGLETKGYFGAACDGRHVYFTPCRTRDFHGYALRYDTQKPFADQTSWQSHDASRTDDLLTTGFGGSIFDGRYVYYVPLLANRQRHARVLRYDTSSAFDNNKSWEAFDAQRVGGPRAAGYCGAAFDGRRVYFAPFGYTPTANSIVLCYDTRAVSRASPADGYRHRRNRRSEDARLLRRRFRRSSCLLGSVQRRSATARTRRARGLDGADR